MLVFIFSTGRNAGGFTEIVLSSLGISCCHERRPRTLRLLNNIRNPFFKKLAYQLIIRRDLQKVKGTNPVQIEHNCMIPNFVENIFKDFPDSIFIHQVRDPRDWVKSTINRSMTSPIRRFLTLSMPFWISRPRNYHLGSDPVSKVFEMQILNWVRENKIYSELKSKTDKYFLVKYEDLKTDPLNFIKSILKICGCPDFYDEEVLKKSIAVAARNESSGFIGSWETWDDKYISFLYRHCKELMEEYGYGTEKEWQEKISKM